MQITMAEITIRLSFLHLNLRFRIEVLLKRRQRIDDAVQPGIQEAGLIGIEEEIRIAAQQKGTFGTKKIDAMARYRYSDGLNTLGLQ